jgi:hypothetical protein
VNIMELNIIPVTETARVLHDAELDTVVAGVPAVQILLGQAWVSPMAIHGFNPQPDPPAFGSLLMPGTAHA